MNTLNPSQTRNKKGGFFPNFLLAKVVAQFGGPRMCGPQNLLIIKVSDTHKCENKKKYQKIIKQNCSKVKRQLFGLQKK